MLFGYDALHQIKIIRLPESLVQLAILFMKMLSLYIVYSADV
jgi:hypothetical protein